MKAYIVYCGISREKRTPIETGRLLARDEEHALRMAAEYWGRGRSYKVKLARSYMKGQRR